MYSQANIYRLYICEECISYKDPVSGSSHQHLILLWLDFKLLTIKHCHSEVHTVRSLFCVSHTYTSRLVICTALFILFSLIPLSSLWMALSSREQWQWGSAGPEGHFSAWPDTLGPCCLAAQHGSPPYIRRTLPKSAKRSPATYLKMNELSRCSTACCNKTSMFYCWILFIISCDIKMRYLWHHKGVF